MAVTNTVLLSSLEFTDELQRGVSARREWKVIVDSPSDTDVDILSAVGVTVGISSYPTNALAIATSIKASRRDGWDVWRVVASYSTNAGSTEDTQNPPTSRRVKRSATTKTITRAVTRERQDVLTSRGVADPPRPIAVKKTRTPYDPPPIETLYCPVARFERWENSFSTAIQQAYCGKVNNSQFGAYPTGNVMCTAIDASEEYENDGNGNILLYWNVIYEFTALPDGDTWDAYLLNADFFRLDPDDSDNRKAIYFDDDGTVVDPSDPTGSPTPVAVLLDPDTGDVATPTEIENAITSGEFETKYVNKFYIPSGANFNALSLPVN